MTGLSGGPDEVFGGVLVADVVRTIRGLRPGFWCTDDVKERYLKVTGHQPSPRLRQVVRIVTLLGQSREYHRGCFGWRITPARLAERWPRYPWS